MIQTHSLHKYAWPGRCEKNTLNYYPCFYQSIIVQFSRNSSPLQYTHISYIAVGSRKLILRLLQTLELKNLYD